MKWHVGMKPGPIVYGEQGEQIADCMSVFLPAEENKANARLIAAAPDLYDALNAINKAVIAKGFGNTHMPELSQAWAALAKAEGWECEEDIHTLEG